MGPAWPSIALRAFATWCVILALAFANGFLRTGVLLPALGTPAALVLSGLLLSLVVLVVAWLAVPWFGPASRATLLAIGLGWVALTLVFEFGIGLAQGHSWATMLQAYTFKDGNLWPVVLLVTALAPLVAGSLRRPRPVSTG